MSEKILYLTLKKKWFDLIKSGQKTSEFREIKPYWIKRLTELNKYTSRQEIKFRLKNFPNNNLKRFDYIIFTNGYAKDSPKIKVEWKGLKIGEFEGNKCFEILLGKIINL